MDKGSCSAAAPPPSSPSLFFSSSSPSSITIIAVLLELRAAPVIKYWLLLRQSFSQPLYTAVRATCSSTNSITIARTRCTQQPDERSHQLLREISTINHAGSGECSQGYRFCNSSVCIILHRFIPIRFIHSLALDAGEHAQEQRGRYTPVGLLGKGCRAIERIAEMIETFKIDDNDPYLFAFVSVFKTFSS